jgi:hypothetical protein
VLDFDQGDQGSECLILDFLLIDDNEDQGSECLILDFLLIDC